ncbi:hypothetical protein D9V32_14405 [Mycetocola tolaasinivorans]|uniref:Peptidase M14 domain-containing protein n=1 Tax=Mycetocola tolaasinivorans TaxID=76635 RepID=A0A3L7A294_9MICO|nr:M14 family zinc carboxypeptidase [Mycetocola tolaasinivorans]RLP73711.1 hypothetical protein D9V32_14405 [Mycetocola tolaasinivorans]
MAIRKLVAASALSTLLIGGLALGPPAAAAPGEAGPQLLTVPASAADLIADLDVVEATNDGLVVLADPETAGILAQRGVSVTRSVSYADSVGQGSPAPRARSFAAAAEPAYPVPARLAGTEYATYFGGYRTSAAYEQFAGDIAEKYPELVQRVNFGRSWNKVNGRGGSDLLAVRITADVAKQPAPDNGQQGRPRFVLAAQAHAREIITSELAWRYATELLNGYGVDPQITSLLDSTEVWINFQNNPDGIRLVETALETSPKNATGDAVPANSSRAWQRKNANDTLFAPTSANWSSQQYGVDLNRNWAYKWGGASTSTNPTSPSYLGVSPSSEPEITQFSALLTELFGEYRTESDSAAPETRTGTYVNLHAYADYVIYPYAYSTTDAVPNLEPIKANAFRQSFVNGFQTGKAGEILYNNAGNDIDWIYSQLGVPAYTYEIGTGATGGFFPAYSRVPGFWEKTAPGIRFAAEAAYAPYTAALGGVVTEVDAVRGEDGTVTVSGSATDEAYGNERTSAARRPATTDITAVQAALATDRNAINEATALSIATPGKTVIFSGDIAVDRTNSAANSVFVRAQNGSGEWGPWRAAAAPALDAPVYTGDTEFDLVAGEEQALSLPVTSAVPASFTVTEGALPAGLTLNEATGALTGTARVAGPSTATVRIDNGVGHVDVELTFAVSAAELARFALSISAEAPQQGDTITVTALGHDDFGNVIADYSDRVTLTSSVDTDIIEGNRVTFRHASPHVITATLDGVSTSILVEVTPVIIDGGTPSPTPSVIPSPSVSPSPTATPSGTPTPTDGGTGSEAPTAAPTTPPSATPATSSATPAVPGGQTPSVTPGATDSPEEIATTGIELAGFVAVMGLLLGAGALLALRRRRTEV